VLSAVAKITGLFCTESSVVSIRRHMTLTPEARMTSPQITTLQHNRTRSALRPLLPAPLLPARRHESQPPRGCARCCLLVSTTRNRHANTVCAAPAAACSVAACSTPRIATATRLRPLLPTRQHDSQPSRGCTRCCLLQPARCCLVLMPGAASSSRQYIRSPFP
jgi:hypothetical protein